MKAIKWFVLISALLIACTTVTTPPLTSTPILTPAFSPTFETLTPTPTKIATISPTSTATKIEVMQSEVVATTVPTFQESIDKEGNAFLFWDLPEVIDTWNPPLPESLNACPRITDLDILIDMENELLNLHPEINDINREAPYYDILIWSGSRAVMIHEYIYPISCAKMEMGGRGHTYLVGLLVRNTDDSNGILHAQFGGEIDGETISEWVAFPSPEDPHVSERPIPASTEEVFDIFQSMRLRKVALALKVVNSSDFRWTESTAFSEELLDQQPNALQLISDIRRISGRSFMGIVGPEHRQLILPLSTIFAVPEDRDSFPEDQDKEKPSKEGVR